MLVPRLLVSATALSISLAFLRRVATELLVVCFVPLIGGELDFYNTFAIICFTFTISQ